MLLRDLAKSNSANDGTRSLLESIMIPEVDAAFKDWVKSTTHLKSVLIGGVALSYYAKPRATTDVDVLFMALEDIPAKIPGFKRTRPGAFQHDGTHVEIEVLSPASINMPAEVAQAIYDHARVEDGVRIASPSGLIASKLGRFSLQDKADIYALYVLGDIDLSKYSLPAAWLEKYTELVKTF